MSRYTTPLDLKVGDYIPESLASEFHLFLLLFSSHSSLFFSIFSLKEWRYVVVPVSIGKKKKITFILIEAFNFELYSHCRFFSLPFDSFADLIFMELLSSWVKLFLRVHEFYNI